MSKTTAVLSFPPVTTVQLSGEMSTALMPGVLALWRPWGGGGGGRGQMEEVTSDKQCLTGWEACSLKLLRVSAGVRPSGSFFPFFLRSAVN